MNSDSLITDPSFRVATEFDAEILLPFMRDYYAFDGHAFDQQKARAALITLLRDPNLGRVWLILTNTNEADKKIEREPPVGYIVLCFGYSLEWLGRDAFVDEFYLLPEHRGHGLGRKTMVFVEEAARSLHVRALHLEVVRQNAAALQIYRKLGYKDRESTFLSKWIAQDFSKPKAQNGH